MYWNGHEITNFPIYWNEHEIPIFQFIGMSMKYPFPIYWNEHHCQNLETVVQNRNFLYLPIVTYFRFYIAVSPWPPPLER